MQLLVAAVGKRMPAWVQQGWEEYARRFPRGLSLALKEIPLARRGANAALDVLRSAEGIALQGAVPAGFRQVALTDVELFDGLLRLAHINAGDVQFAYERK